MINWYDKVNIIRPDLSGYRRIIAVSDIHANLDYFQHLLEKIEFGKESEKRMPSSSPETFWKKESGRWIRSI